MLKFLTRIFQFVLAVVMLFLALNVGYFVGAMDRTDGCSEIAGFIICNSDNPSINQ